MQTISPEELSTFVARIFHNVGTAQETADFVADSLVKSNLAGHDSHGVIRTEMYTQMITTRNLITPNAEPTVARSHGVVTMVDAQRSFGQVSARYAISIAIDKAKEQGVAMTGLYNCNHIGRVGEWVEMAAAQNMIGLAFCNGGSAGGLVAPHGGAERRLGTDPIAAAFPIADMPPVVIDFATSALAEGKLRVARNKGVPVPDGVVLDSEGTPSTDPNDFYKKGMLRPVGGHKGYALGLMMEFLGGALTGAGCTPFAWFTPVNGVLFMVLDINAFRPLDEFLADGKQLVEHVKNTKPMAGFDEVLVPGEPERRTAAERQKNGIPLDDNTWAQIVAVADTVSNPGSSVS